MDIFAELIVAILGGGASAYAVVRFLGESLVRHRLDAAVQARASELTQKTEALKAQLSIYAHEQNVALARVDTQGAQALHNIYAALRAWIRPAASVVAGSPLMNVDEEQHLAFYSDACEAMHAACRRLLETLADNAIYVDNDLHTTLVNLGNLCAQAGAEALAPLRQGYAEGWPTKKIAHEFEICRQAFSREYQSMIFPLSNTITEKFRSILGTLRARAV